MSLGTRLAIVGSELRGVVASVAKLAVRGPAPALTRSVEPPVVAQLVIEVRSDGSFTIARGALVIDGETTAIEAQGTTPAELAASLARTVAGIPALLLARTLGA
jgi:hypothetical protein